MEIINSLKLINRFFMLGTIVILVIEPYSLLLLQICLGLYQVLAAIILLFFWNTLTKKGRVMLRSYWLVVFLFWIFNNAGWLEYFDRFIFNLLGINKYSHNTFKDFFSYAFFPLSIAVFFTYLLETLKSKKGII